MSSQRFLRGCMGGVFTGWVVLRWVGLCWDGQGCDGMGWDGMCLAGLGWAVMSVDSLEVLLRQALS